MTAHPSVGIDDGHAALRWCETPSDPTIPEGRRSAKERADHHERDHESSDEGHDDGGPDDPAHPEAAADRRLRAGPRPAEEAAPKLGRRRDVARDRVRDDPPRPALGSRSSAERSWSSDRGFNGIFIGVLPGGRVPVLAGRRAGATSRCPAEFAGDRAEISATVMSIHVMEETRINVCRRQKRPNARWTPSVVERPSPAAGSRPDSPSLARPSMLISGRQLAADHACCCGTRSRGCATATRESCSHREASAARANPDAHLLDDVAAVGLIAGDRRSPTAGAGRSEDG